MTAFDRAQERQRLAEARSQRIDEAKELRKHLVDERAALINAKIALRDDLLDNCASLTEAVLQYEGFLIKYVLQRNAGQVAATARELGLSHQSLSYILNTRHADLRKRFIQTRKRRERTNA